ncbi:hypothetical protein ACFQET_00655 [Levilactobacillus tangyuanensis]|uniref:PcfJ-like protein n=2 Tax=Levilactobacillus tangyuanensis TaxID=2486021 RepID=A0ABW1TJI3_9LACO
MMATTILTPAENRFLQLSQPAIQVPALTRVLPTLRDHPTIKDSSDFLTRSTRQILLDQRVNWLIQGSLAWKLLARLPYAINDSDQRQDWHHCALCHKPVRYEYHVVLKATDREVLVGSECVKKFMSDELQYLMTITTEDNFHAVTQYDALTAKHPEVPEILWDREALPNLPEALRPQRRQVRQGTHSTVTGYLRHRQASLPERQLAPYLHDYQGLQAADQQATADLVAQRRVVQQRAQDLAEREAQAAWDAANAAQTTAEQQLRQSTVYRDYLRSVAALIADRTGLTTFKQQLTKVTQPRQLKRLVNSYQLGVMATEFLRTGQIKAERLQIVPRYFVADLNRVTRRLAAQRLRDWQDDLFNAAVGFDLDLAERQQTLATLRQSWEGQQVPATVYQDLLTLRDRLTAGKAVPQSWPTALRTAFTHRLAVQPTSGWVPAKKNHVTPIQLQQLVRQSVDFTQLTRAYHRLYTLSAKDEAVILSALEQAQLQLADQQAGRAQATRSLVDRILSKD